jgi:TRAP-type C4-dicarboxylate transport system permease small subunit
VRSIVRAAEGLATLTGWVAGFLLMLTTGLILFEIALRQLFGRSTLIAEEYSGYFMAGIVYLAAAYTLHKGEHIRVGLLRERLDPVWQRRLDLLAGVLGLAFATLLVIALANQTLDALRYGTRSFLPSRTPLVYPYAVALTGAAVLWAGFVAFVLRRWVGEEG